MKVSEIILNSNLRRVPKGRNVDMVGWYEGYLVVVFSNRLTRYIFGPDVPETEAEKIVKNPYPDALFSKLKKHWKCFKVEVGK